jgi:hypothetical protein
MTAPQNSEWPWKFYFNGHELSVWTAQWHLCDLGDLLNGYQDDWDEFVGYRHIWHLETRLDHVGVIESEDPFIFRVCAQEALLALIKNREAVVERIRQSLPDGSMALTVFDELIAGTARMIERVDRDGIAIWTSGGEAELERLEAFVSQHRCMTIDVAEDLPHVRQRRSELSLRCDIQLKDLRSLAQSGALDKQLRRIIHQLRGFKSEVPR